MTSRLKAWALALACAIGAPLVPMAEAQNVRIVSGGALAPIQVPMNRAIVVESDEPFGEVSIANPGIADFNLLSDRTIYLLGKAPGRTTLTLLAPDGRLISNSELQVIPDIAEFKERLGQILPGEPIEVRTANDGIVLSGTVSSTRALDRAMELAERYAPGRVSNLMGVGGTQQVMLKVRFSEMNREVRKELSAGLSANAETGLGSDLGADVSFDTASGLIGASFSIGGSSLNVLLQALENRGLVRFLAEPNLTALSGQEASFLAGGEFAVPVNDIDGGTTVSFKPFGIQLKFIPRVLDGNTINLELATTVSSLDNSIAVGEIPGLRTRSTSTTVEMRDGESFAIAGLLLDDFTDTKEGVPLLSDLPILGTLFRSTSFRREQSELVIIITAHLVKPTRGENYALPTDRVRIPTERELFLFGRTEGQLPQGGGAGEVARQDFGGSYGYVMD